MSDFLIRHYEEVNSSCNEGQYVRDCVKNTTLPGKFKGVLESRGIVYNKSDVYSKCDTWESSVPVEFPKGWKMQQHAVQKSKLVVLNEKGSAVFEASVVDRHGYATWKISLI